MSEIAHFSFVRMKLEDQNYSKQLCIIKIVNGICLQNYGFNLVAYNY